MLIYNEWFDAMTTLSSDEYKALMEAIYKAQIHNAPPPAFTGTANAIASIIFPYIERRKKQSERGRAGATARYSGGDEPVADDKTSANGTAISQNKIKTNKIKSIYNKSNPSKADAPAAKEESSFDLEDFFEAAVRRSLGDASEEESA